jgi:exodeoxyribonuclease VII small subunit
LPLTILIPAEITQFQVIWVYYALINFLWGADMAARKKKVDYEAAVTELESLVERLEQGDISLEESLKLYESGVLLTRDCQEALNAAEQKVQMLLEQSGQNTLVDFDPNAN